jgi:hypothetical protein
MFQPVESELSNLLEAMAAVATAIALLPPDDPLSEQPDERFTAFTTAPTTADDAAAIRAYLETVVKQQVVATIVGFGHQADAPASRQTRTGAFLSLGDIPVYGLLWQTDVFGAGVKQRQERLQKLNRGDQITVTLTRFWDSSKKENRVTVVFSEREAGLEKYRRLAGTSSQIVGENATRPTKDPVEVYAIMLEPGIAGWLPAAMLRMKKLGFVQRISVHVDRITDAGEIMLKRRL